jgi:metallophosphoesterase (TIGR00282 family)
LKVLFIGDIMGKPGRSILREHLAFLKDEYAPDVVIANGENLAGGLGATAQLIREITDSGVHIVTMGNHIWRRPEFIKEIDSLDNVVRPANFPQDSPGVPKIVYDVGDGRRVAVFNLVGRTFMESNDCPFRAGFELAQELRKRTPIVILDLHAEATSEKMAMGWYLDGKISAMLGTHTHVQTADERILPQGTAYITDVGMTGAHDGIIGMKAEQVLTRFVTGIPSRYEVAEEDLRLSGVVVVIDDNTGHAISIERVFRPFANPANK